MTHDDDARRILDVHADSLSALPNVVGVGIVDDAVAVYVSEKVPEAELAPAAIVPKQLAAGGKEIRTRVIEVGTITPQ